MSQPLKKLQLKIHGMHCASCEVLIERKFKKVAGIEEVRVSHVSGKAYIYCSEEPNLRELQNAIKPDGYTVSLWREYGAGTESPHRNTKNDGN